MTDTHTTREPIESGNRPTGAVLDLVVDRPPGGGVEVAAFLGGLPFAGPIRVWAVDPGDGDLVTCGWYGQVVNDTETAPQQVRKLARMCAWITHEDQCRHDGPGRACPRCDSCSGEGCPACGRDEAAA